MVAAAYYGPRKGPYVILKSEGMRYTDRYAVLVDAGYFFAAGAQTLHKTVTTRRHTSLVSPEGLIKALTKRASSQAFTDGTSVAPAGRLLRVYWYDALLGPRPTPEQTTIAHLAGVKLRLGSMNNAGEQKGVDSLIVTDLIELAQNRAVSDAILVSGDEDLRIAVQIAQTYGVRVHVLAVGDPKKNVSAALQMEADSVEILDEQWLREHIAVTPPASVRTTSAPTTISPPLVSNAKAETPFDVAAQGVCDELLKGGAPSEIGLLGHHFATNTSVPPEYDGKLIAKIAGVIGRPLTPDEKRQARGMFVRHVRTLDVGHALPGASTGKNP